VEREVPAVAAAEARRATERRAVELLALVVRGAALSPTVDVDKTALNKRTAAPERRSSIAPSSSCLDILSPAFSK
jgi:hypothetical protein